MCWKPGSGKTALALHTAHRMLPRYPDGALFLEFGPPDPPGTLAAASEVLDHLLRRLGQPSEAIPASVGERAARYRALLAERRVLIVLDNVRRAEQVTALIPATPGCCVIITSRSPLRALDQGTPLYLRPLPDAAATVLFHAVSGVRTVPGQATGRAVAQIVTACGGLPLAVRIAAARCRSAPLGTLEALATSLHDRHDIDPLDDGERSLDSVMHAAVAELPEPHQRLLGLLAISPTPAMALPAVAWITGDSAHTTATQSPTCRTQASSWSTAGASACMTSSALLPPGSRPNGSANPGASTRSTG